MCIYTAYFVVIFSWGQWLRERYFSLLQKTKLHCFLTLRRMEIKIIIRMYTYSTQTYIYTHTHLPMKYILPREEWIIVFVVTENRYTAVDNNYYSPYARHIPIYCSTIFRQTRIIILYSTARSLNRSNGKIRQIFYKHIIFKYNIIKRINWKIDPRPDNCSFVRVLWNVPTIHIQYTYTHTHIYTGLM